MIVVDELTSKPTIKHGFFTREGGVSSGLYGSLNCGFGSDDKAENVAENRQRVLAGLGISDGQLLTCYQIHSATVVVVEEAWALEDAPEADAMVTNKLGIALGILTADCAPVLFADEKAGVIGVAHAGWRGAFTGVLEETLAAMVKIGASKANISAAIGPCIGQNSYEVGPEFIDRFIEQAEKNTDYFLPSKRDGHHMFDLAAYVADRLQKAEIARIYQTGYDTCQDEKLFYSYRRSVLQGEKDYGREISAISLVQ